MKEVPVSFPTVRVQGLPTSYLVDRAGNVAVREIGERKWSDEVSQTAVLK